MPISTIGTAGLAASTTLTTPTLASANITTALTLTGASGTNGQFLTSAGSGSAPTWTTVSASQWTTTGSNIFYNTGVVSIGAAPPAWAGFKVLDVGSVTSLWAQASGNGTSYYSNNLYYDGGSRIYKTTGGASEYTQSGGSHQWYVAASGTAGNSVSLSEAMRITSTRDILFGTTSAPNTSGGGSGFINDGESRWQLRMNQSTTDARALQSFNNPNGGVGSIQTSGTSTSYNTSSDYRLKENIAPMTGALAKVAQLKPCTYKWKADGTDGEGFIAHELAEVCPQAVAGTKDATCEEEYEVTPAVKDELGNITTPAVIGIRTVLVHQGVDTSFLVATLTAAIQELKAINDTQTATITALTARIVALESRT